MIQPSTKSYDGDDDDDDDDADPHEKVISTWAKEHSRNFPTYSNIFVAANSNKIKKHGPLVHIYIYIHTESAVSVQYYVVERSM